MTKARLISLLMAASLLALVLQAALVPLGFSDGP